MSEAGNATVDEFLDVYKQLEDAIRDVYHVDDKTSAVHLLKQQKRFARYANTIDCCREVRNFLQHTPKVSGSYPVVPSRELVTFLSDLVGRVRGRPRVYDIAVRAASIVGCAPGDEVSAVIKLMHRRGRSHLPVFVDGKVRGVFDEDTLFTYIAEQGVTSSFEGKHVRDMERYITLEGRRSEVFTFHPRNQYADEAETEFDRQSAAGKRVVLAFVTEHGKPDERILGLFTAWDLLLARA